MEPILLAYDLLKETATIIMRLNKNINTIVHSTDGDTNFFNIFAGILQGDTLALLLFIICLDYILQMSLDLMKENGVSLKKKARSRRYPTKTITDADYADDLALLANTHTQTKYPLQSLDGQKLALAFT